MKRTKKCLYCGKEFSTQSAVKKYCCMECAEAAKLEAEGEAEYMRILSDAYSDAEKAEFYNFVRSLDAAKASLTNDSNILFLGPDSPLTQIFYETGAANP